MITPTIFLTHSLIHDELTLKDKNIVIIDVLRATSTMAVALSNGAKEIIPSDSVSKAAKIAKGAGNSLLCGERGGKIVEGFNLGNSPSEYLEEVIKDKTLVFSTTNGTMSILKAKYAKSCVLASFINVDRVLNYLKELNEDFTIICSGKLNNFCIEDAALAGYIIMNLFGNNSTKEEINDPERTAEIICKYYLEDKQHPTNENIFRMFKETEHGKYLAEIGFESDLRFCAEMNSYPVLPVIHNGIIKLKESVEKESEKKASMKKVSVVEEGK
ncbi:MAG TPA: 2-phosphosulfolactate phosphatase [Ignavibacteria bacterium]|nr:2-phosphosulfolactate phosphatase [Ignavibacteria bacterium]